MKIVINDRKTISVVQNEFSRLFPCLKLEFFSKPHQSGFGSEKKFMIEKHKTLYECRTIHYNGEININPAMKVSELEQSFNNIYGLSVQVFRKSGKVWIETTSTDNWTLEKENEEVEANSKPVPLVDQ